MTDVPGYRLEEEIGSGSAGVVYRATRLADGVGVAVKVLRGDLVAGDPGYLRLLRAEAGLAGSVEHHGVVRVHEVGSDGEVAWLVMDLVTGPNLQRLLDEGGPLPAKRAAELMAGVADAVAAMHASGLVHRDLKPANILLEGEVPLVADFGVARHVATVESTLGIGLTGGTDWAHTGTGSGSRSQPGTVAYMAPEQWRGEEGDARTDVYALGGTLYAALTGRRPFQHRSLPELAYAVAMTPPPAPSEAGAPVAFDTVVATAMAKDPDERYPGAATFGAAVRAAASGRPLPEVKPKATPAAASARTRPRRRRLVAIAAGATAVLIIVAGLLLWQPWSTEPTTVEKIVCARDMTVRDGPRSRNVIATLLRDDRVQVHTGSAEPGWSQVDLPDGRQGWVLVQYLGPPC